MENHNETHIGIEKLRQITEEFCMALGIPISYADPYMQNLLAFSDPITKVSIDALDDYLQSMSVRMPMPKEERTNWRHDRLGFLDGCKQSGKRR